MSRLFAPMLLLALAGCSEFDRGTISNRLGREIRDPEVSRVDLARLTSFGWDEVFLFAPHTPRAEICAALGVRERFCRLVVRFESIDDAHTTIAFRKQGRVTHAELHHRLNGDFMAWPSGRALRRESAQFRVVADGLAPSGETLLRLVPD